MQLNLFFRKRYPTAFSIERLFTQLAERFRARDVVVRHLELPEYNNTLSAVRNNIAWAQAQEQGGSGARPAVNHVTGDVTSVIFRLRGPCVLTFHDCNPLLRYPKWHPRYWFYRWVIYEWPARRAAAVTVISEKTREELLRLTSCREDNVHVIPNFVDPAIEARPKPFAAARPTILQIGTKENKNIARLAAALENLPCTLAIVGRPSDMDMAALDRHGIDYRWSEGLSDSTVREWYTNCDLVAFVSTYEGFGLPILEAQATGRPVVASDLSPHREVAGAGGAALADPYDSASIRQAIERIINDHTYRDSLIENGRANVEHYGIDAIADRYLRLYSSLI